MVGIVEIEAARLRAREAELDLVEISGTAVPPVVRIMDFGKWKYEQSKKDKANKAKTKSSELKEVRLGRSMKIDPHDIAIRLEQARRFLCEGHKVQIVQNFRGREMLHKERGRRRMEDIMERLSDIGKVEVPPRIIGRRITIILAPDRAKIEQLKQRQAAQQATAASPPDQTPPPNAADVKAVEAGGASPVPAAAPLEPVAPAERVEAKNP
jgi:translation initiation factor IF-3